MTALPSPIPHPLDGPMWDLPSWADEAVAWVLSLSWPEADERQTWDVADRWYAAAHPAAEPPVPSLNPGPAPQPARPIAVEALKSPDELRPSAHDVGAAMRPRTPVSATSSLAGDGNRPGAATVHNGSSAGTGAAWRLVAPSDRAPADIRAATSGVAPGGVDPAADFGSVVSLLDLSEALGQVIEECGHDIEAAKLEAWIELVTFLIELVGTVVAVALTLGAAGRAVDALITATRFAIQQTFRRLDNQLARKTVAAPAALA